MAFDLKSIVKGKDIRPPRVVLFGTPGVGKSTFAAGAPNPIFLPTEDGLDAIDVAKFPLATSTTEVHEAIKSLHDGEHDFGTIVIDSLDWLEQIMWREIEAKYTEKDLAYGKGSVIAAGKWNEILAGLNALRNDRGMAVVLIAHSHIKRFDSPETEPYERYLPKLDARSNAIIREWADAVLFANYKTIIRTSDVGFNKEVKRGVTTGERLLHCNEKPAYVAKNRWGLPDTLPMQWSALQAAILGQPAAKAA